MNYKGTKIDKKVKRGKNKDRKGGLKGDKGDKGDKGYYKKRVPVSENSLL